METWKEVSCNTEYLVSDTGKIRSKRSDREKAPRISKGYMIVDVYKDGQRSTKRIHRLVAEAFVPNPHNKPDVNHKDGNKLNNSSSNLEWVTKKENCKHAWENGLVKPSYSMLGRSNPNAGRKSKPFRIVETGEVFQNLKECERAINGNNRHISECLNGKQKTHRNYHFEYI